MDENSYHQLLEENAGYTPGLVVSPEQVAAIDPGLVQDENKRYVLPFASVVLPFHDVVFSTAGAVHDFVKSHYTRKLRDLTLDRPLYVRACSVSGWTVLEQLSRKGLIVDLPAQIRVQRLVSGFPVALRHSVKPHLLNKNWFFFTLAPNNRKTLAKHLEEHLEAGVAEGCPPRQQTMTLNASRDWPNGF